MALGQAFWGASCAVGALLGVPAGPPPPPGVELAWIDGPARLVVGRVDKRASRGGTLAPVCDAQASGASEGASPVPGCVSCIRSPDTRGRSASFGFVDERGERGVEFLRRTVTDRFHHVDGERADLEALFPREVFELVPSLAPEAHHDRVTELCHG